MFLISLIPFRPTKTERVALQNGFVYLDEHIPGIKLEPRYATANNFTANVIPGYNRKTCILSIEAANALKKVQADLKIQGLALKVYDAYRPQQAVNYFVQWAKDLSDTTNKRIYYPKVKKSELFEKGYIAARSGHTRGSTVDLTIINLKTGVELDMGTPYDYFSPLSWPNSKGVSAQAQSNRWTLQRVMEKHGFLHLPTEWWHFTLDEEPYPNTYFDFAVE